MRRRYYVFIGWLLALGGIVPLVAQTTCPTIVEAALAEMGDNCGGLERNSACYGYNRVGAAFATEVAEDFFSRPADTTDLAPLTALETAALNIITGEWGVAVMSVQANLPDTLPGQAVTFLLFGDTQLENDGVETAAVSSIEVTVTENINLRSGAGLNRNVVGVAAAGNTFSADGISADGDWLRVAYNDAPAWIRSTLVTTAGDVTTLPIISHENPAPMQAFYLTTGIGQSGCQEAPDVLLVQGTENYEIDLTVNGAEIRIGSTVLFRTVGDALEITVIDGKVTLLPDEFNSQEVIIPEGFRSFACLGATEDAANEGDADDRPVACAWSEPERADLAPWCSLEDVPVNVLNYPINVPCEPASSNVPVVNNLQPEAPVPPVRPTLTPECQNFQRLGGGERMLSQYRWSNVPQADQYKLYIYDANGQLVASRWYPAPVTTADLNLSDFPTGGAFQWEVEALLNGQTLCNTGRSVLTLRPGDTTPPGSNTPPDLFTARKVCAGTTNVTVFWDNAADTETFTIIITGVPLDVAVVTGSGKSGSAGAVITSGITSIQVFSSTGRSLNLGACP